jgi:aryl-alcohol dehydrogenase-like predicted oxidoreductase
MGSSHGKERSTVDYVRLGASGLTVSSASPSFPGARWPEAGSPATTASPGRPPPHACESDAFARELYDREDQSIVDQVHTIATERNVAMAHIALAWLLHNPAVTAPIVGAPRSAYVDDAVAALAVRLYDEEIVLLNATYRPHSLRGHT